MAKREVCMCEKCGNEAEMTVTCQTVEVGGVQEEKKTSQCSVCGNKTERTA
ncbi:MAG: hypothetical protein LLG06_14690 [Desulfobacteraceae bacterium]|nr:hypothetical protein [Desulfobacteraceae bacterium]